jgi:hypothetical protein
VAAVATLAWIAGTDDRTERHARVPADENASRD